MHMISFNAAGAAEAMFAGTPAWHGLGTLVPDNVSPREALDLAGLNWRAERVAIQTVDGTPIESHVALVRSDDRRYLATVTDSYVPMQHDEQASFIEALVGSGAVVNTCGAIQEGRRQFWTVEAPGEIVVRAKGGADPIKRYLTIANAHDKTLSFRGFWSPIRVVCHNTLTAALRDASDGFSVRHTTKMADRLEDARRALGLAEAYYETLRETSQALAEREVLAAEVDAFLASLFPLADDASKATVTRTEKRREAVLSNFESGVGHEVAGKTAWGLWNAATELTSHAADEGDTDGAEARFTSLLLGTGRSLNERALAAALELVTA